jgi:hypothetical protein
MKNFKKIAFGLLVGALAIGFSAFTNGNKNPIKITKLANGKFLATARYYNIRPDHAPSVAPADFVYVNNTSNRCDESLTNQCTAQWTTSNTPTAGQSPTDAGSPAIVAGSGTLGEFNGNVIP